MSGHPRAWSVGAAVGLASIVIAPCAAAAAPTKDECINANDAAQTARQAGQLREAKKQLLVCVAKSCPGPVRDDCSDRLNEVEKAMPSVVLAATDAQGNDLTEVRVSVDGQPLAERLDGTPVEVDPGAHVFRFEAEGTAPTTKKVVVRETEKLRKVSVALGGAPVPDAAGAGVAQNGADAGEVSSPSRWPAYVAFGTAGVGLVIGVVFLVEWFSEGSTISNQCSTLTSSQCSAQHQPEINQQKTDSVVAGVGFGVAAIGVGGGTVLLLTGASGAPAAQGSTGRRLRVTPRLGLGWAGVGGEFE